jgi:hypothetical protein
MKTLRPFLAAGLLVLLLLLPALAAHAQLTFTLAKPNQVGRPGGLNPDRRTVLQASSPGILSRLQESTDARTSPYPRV